MRNTHTINQLFSEARELFREAVETCQATQNGDIPSDEAMKRVAENTRRASELVREAFRLMQEDTDR